MLYHALSSFNEKTWREPAISGDQISVDVVRFGGDVDELPQKRQQLVAVEVEDERLQQLGQLVADVEAHLRPEEGAVEVDEDLLDSRKGGEEANGAAVEIQDKFDGVFGFHARTSSLYVALYFAAVFGRNHGRSRENRRGDVVQRLI